MAINEEEEMSDDEIKAEAIRLVGITQGTMALEGMGLNEGGYNELIAMTILELRRRRDFPTHEEMMETNEER
jgi:hypothetical protein